VAASARRAVVFQQCSLLAARASGRPLRRTSVLLLSPPPPPPTRQRSHRGVYRPKYSPPPAGITATATTTVNGVLVVETRERAQHQRFIAAYNHYFIFFSSKMFLAFALSMRSPATLIIFLLLLLLLFAFYPFRPVGGESLRQHNARYYYLSHNNRYYRLGKNKNLETYIIFYYYIRTHIYNYLPLRLAARQPPANNNQDPRTIL